MFKDIYKRKGLTKVTSPTGEPIRIKRGWTYEDGELVFKEKGVTNVYEEIQAAAESVDLHAIMNRYENGDQNALNKVKGMYIDAVDLPKNYAQLYDSVSKANQVFEVLPADIKAEFNNNPATFWKSYGEEEFDNIINAYRKNTLERYGLADDNPVESFKKSDKSSEPVVTNDTVVEKESNNE